MTKGVRNDVMASSDSGYSKQVEFAVAGALRMYRESLEEASCRPEATPGSKVIQILSSGSDYSEWIWSVAGREA
jgi:hypothetical protein